jgi:hypothetical protein
VALPHLLQVIDDDPSVEALPHILAIITEFNRRNHRDKKSDSKDEKIMCKILLEKFLLILQKKNI